MTSDFCKECAVAVSLLFACYTQSHLVDSCQYLAVIVVAESQKISPDLLKEKMLMVLFSVPLFLSKKFL